MPSEGQQLLFDCKKTKNTALLLNAAFLLFESGYRLTHVIVCNFTYNNIMDVY